MKNDIFHSFISVRESRKNVGPAPGSVPGLMMCLKPEIIYQTFPQLCNTACVLFLCGCKARFLFSVNYFSCCATFEVFTAFEMTALFTRIHYTRAPYVFFSYGFFRNLKINIKERLTRFMRHYFLKSFPCFINPCLGSNKLAFSYKYR